MFCRINNYTFACKRVFKALFYYKNELLQGISFIKILKKGDINIKYGELYDLFENIWIIMNFCKCGLLQEGCNWYKELTF